MSSTSEYDFARCSQNETCERGLLVQNSFVVKRDRSPRCASCPVHGLATLPTDSAPRTPLSEPLSSTLLVARKLFDFAGSLDALRGGLCSMVAKRGFRFVFPGGAPPS